jgi:hypothetical protein
VTLFKIPAADADFAFSGEMELKTRVVTEWVLPRNLKRHHKNQLVTTKEESSQTFPPARTYMRTNRNLFDLVSILIVRDLLVPQEWTFPL